MDKKRNHPHGEINTAGGAYIKGGVETGGGDFIGRDVYNITAHQVVIQQQTTPVAVGGEPAIAPPPEPVHPPPLAAFIGRQVELAHYAAQLQRTGIAVIAGMAGVGKTSLAAALAQQASPPERIFWHSFRPEEGLEVIIWKLAGFLAWHGKADLWAMLQGVRQRGGQLPPPEVLFDYLLQTLRGQGYLLCLDDFQYIDEDPLLDELVERLTPLLRSGEMSLIITTRRRPGFVQDAVFQPLGGLGLVDVAALVAARGLTLAGDLIAELHNLTAGNCAFLILAIDALRHTAAPRQLLTRLSGAENIEHYLLNQLDRNLDPAARDVLIALAVLDAPSTRDAIEAVLDGPNVRQTLYALDERFLLVSQATAAEERTYTLHAILAAFYEQQPGRRQRQAMHRRAGEFYEVEAENQVRAAFHYQRAGDIARAVELATAGVVAQINQGRVQPLRRLLETFTMQQVNPAQWAAINLARGQVYIFVQEREQAMTSLQAALSTLAVLPNTPDNRRTEARTCRALGALLRSEASQEALDWVQRGLALLEADQGEEAVSLLLLLADIHTRLGNVAQAGQALDAALPMIPQPGPLRIDALTQLSNLARLQGKHAQAVRDGLEAIRLAEQLQDNFALGILWGNLGIDQFYLGEWEASLASQQNALALAEQLGNVVEQIRLTSNLGSLYRDLGDDEAAARCLFAALEQASTQKTLQVDLSYIQCTLADFHLRRNEVAQAVAALEAAATLANALQIRPLHPYIHNFWALAHLAQGQLDQAEAAVTVALALAQEIDNPHTAGTCLRTQGQVLLARGEHAEALIVFVRSAGLFANDPYEAARTRLEWAQALLAGGANDQAKQLLAEAGAVFERLGAQRETAIVQRIVLAS